MTDLFGDVNPTRRVKPQKKATTESSNEPSIFVPSTSFLVISDQDDRHYIPAATSSTQSDAPSISRSMMRRMELTSTTIKLKQRLDFVMKSKVTMKKKYTEIIRKKNMQIKQVKSQLQNDNTRTADNSTETIVSALDQKIANLEKAIEAKDVFILKLHEENSHLRAMILNSQKECQ